MVRIIKYSVAGLVVLIGLFFLGKHLIDLSAEKRAAYVLAEIVATQDTAFADMAVKTLTVLRDPAAVGALAKGLESGNAGVKVRVIEVLDAIEGEESKNLLLAALTDLDTLVSAHAALALAKRGDTAIIDLTNERLDSDDPQVVALSYEILGYLEEGFISRIEQVLNSNDPAMMPSAMRGLVPMIELGDEKAWLLLKRGVNSRYPEVRMASFNAAVKLGGEHRAEALMSAVESSDSGLRKLALQEMSVGEDTARFLDTLKLALNDDDLGVKFAAAWGCYKLRDPTPVAYLRSVLIDKEVSLNDRIIAARIMARLGDPQGADPLYDILEDIEVDELTKLEAAEVLGEYEEIRGMGYLGEAIKPDRSTEVREKALDLLGVMGDRNASVLLHEMAKEDPDESIAVRAAYAYAALNGGRTASILRRFLRSDSPYVRTIAAVGILTGGDITDIIGREGYR